MSSPLIDLPQATDTDTYNGLVEDVVPKDDDLYVATLFAVQEAAAILRVDIAEALFRVARDINAFARATREGSNTFLQQCPMGADVEWNVALLTWAASNASHVSGPDAALTSLQRALSKLEGLDIDDRFLIACAARYDQVSQSFVNRHYGYGRSASAVPPIPNSSACKAIRRLLEKRKAGANAQVEKRIQECDNDESVALDDDMDELLPCIEDRMTGDVFMERLRTLPLDTLRAYLATWSSRDAEVDKTAWQAMDGWAPRIFGPSVPVVWELTFGRPGTYRHGPSPFLPPSEVVSRAAFACDAMPEFHPLRVAWRASDDEDSKGSSLLRRAIE